MRVLRSCPKDLFFVLCTLFLPLAGVLNSKELFYAAINQSTLVLWGAFIFGKAMSLQRIWMPHELAHVRLPLSVLSGEKKGYGQSFYPVPRWKQCTTLLFFAASCASMLLGVAIGTSLCSWALLLLITRPFLGQPVALNAWVFPVFLMLFGVNILLHAFHITLFSY